MSPSAIRARPVLQLDSHDCAPACLRYVLNLMGGDAPLSDIRARCDVREGGVSLLQIKTVAPELGMQPRFFEAEHLADELSAMTPWIAQFRSREEGVAHFVVVRDVGARRVKIMDPGIGHVSLPRATFEAEWTGIMITFSDAGVEPRRRRDLAWIGRQLLQSRRRDYMVISLAGALLVSLLGIGSAYITKELVEAMTSSPFERLFWVALVAFLGFVLVRYLTTAGVGYVVQRLAARLSVRSTDTMTHRFDRLAWSRAASLRHGDVVNRLKDPADIEQFLIVQCGQLAATVLSFLVGVVWVAALYPSLLPAVIVAVVVAVGNFRIFRERLVSLSYRQKNAQVGMDISLMDYARCREALLAANGSDVLLSRFRERFREFNALHVRRVGLLVLMGLGASLCPLLVMAWAVFLLWQADTRTAAHLGDLVFQLTATGFIFGGISSALALLSSMDTMRVSFDRVMDVYTGPQEASAPADTPALHRPVTSVELRGFGFRVGAQQQTISHQVIRRDLTRPWLVALTGSNGVGKSSLIRAIAGVADRTDGALVLDDHAVTEKAHLRRLTSYLPQTDQLFTGSLLHNILLGRTEDEVTQLEATATALRLPRRARTAREMAEVKVFNGGENFSGGQGRRIALTRAIVQDAPLLLLDEPFANIDRESVQEVLDHLRTLDHDFVICVTHDETVIERADAVIDLQAGEAGDRAVQAATRSPDPVGPGARR